MHGDKVFCLNCHRVCVDVWIMYDTRTNDKVKTMCPYCLGSNTKNVEYILEIEKITDRKAKGGSCRGIPSSFRRQVIKAWKEFKQKQTIIY